VNVFGQKTKATNNLNAEEANCQRQFASKKEREGNN
jgi:hypothetical protein